MARDIHDTLAQGFVGILIHVRAARLKVADEHLDIAERLASENLAGARRSVQSLRPNGSGRDPWVGCLRSSLTCLGETATHPVAVAVSGHAPALPHEGEDELLQIAREAVGNAIRYSGEARVDVVVETCGAGGRRVGRGRRVWGSSPAESRRAGSDLSGCRSVPSGSGRF